MTLQDICKLFGVSGESWVCPSLVTELLLIRFVGFRRWKESKLLCILPFWLFYGAYGWMNSRVFPGTSLSFELPWDQITYVAYLWSRVTWATRSCSFSEVHMDWANLLPYGGPSYSLL